MIYFVDGLLWVIALGLGLVAQLARALVGDAAREQHVAGDQQGTEPDGERDERGDRQAATERHVRRYPTPRAVSSRAGAPEARSLARIRAMYASSVF